MNLFKSFIYFVLSVQEKCLTKSLERTIGRRTSSKRKNHYTEGCLLTIDTIADTDKQRLEDEISLILKSASYEPKQILEYIKKHDTEVFYVKSAKSLNSVGENEGFILPQKNAKALYLSLLTSKKIKFKTKGMFVLTNGEINKYYFIYHFYNWYAFKHGIKGLDADSQNLLNKYLFRAEEEDFNKLQLADIFNLKDAIRQDKAAIEFVVKLCRQYDGAKNALEKLKNNGADI